MNFNAFVFLTFMMRLKVIYIPPSQCYIVLCLHLPSPVRQCILCFVLLLSIISLQPKRLQTSLKRCMSNSLSGSSQISISLRSIPGAVFLFLWLYHISPSLHDPCNLAFFEEAVTPSRHYRLALAGKFYTSHIGQKLWTGKLSGTLGGLPGEIQAGLMSESTDRLSLSFCREKTFRLKRDFSQRCLCFVDRNDRRKVKLFYLPFEMNLFSFLCCTRLMKPLASVPGASKRNFHPRAVVKLVFPWNSKAGTSPFCHLSDADLLSFGLSYDV